MPPSSLNSTILQHCRPSPSPSTIFDTQRLPSTSHATATRLKSQIIDYSQQLPTRNKSSLNRKMANRSVDVDESLSERRCAIPCWKDHSVACGHTCCECNDSKCRCSKDEQYHRFDREHQEVFGRAVDDGKMIEVAVGSGGDHKNFAVHEVLLRSTSEFFEKALGGNWKESKERMVGLPHEDPAAFSVYHKWLLLNKFIINSSYDTPVEAMDKEIEASISDSKSQSSASPSTSPSSNPSAGVYDILLECYILGDHLLDPKFKNATIDEILNVMNEPNQFPTGWVSILPKRLPESSGLMRLYEDLWVRQADGDWFEDIYTDNMDEATAYIVSLAKKALDFRNKKRVYFQRHCKYYDGTGKKVCRNQKPKMVSSESDVTSDSSIVDSFGVNMLGQW